MPEYPDITVYIEALEQQILSHTLNSVVLKSPFLLRTATLPLDSFVNQKVVSKKRLGKQIALEYLPVLKQKE